MHWGVGLVVSGIARPQVVSNQSDVALCAHSLRTQASLYLLHACFVQEIVPEHTLVLLQCSGFQLVLAGPEVTVILDTACVFN